METRSKKQIREVLESIRNSIEREDLSYGELAELCDLQGYIEPGDVQLLEAAGVPEFPEGELTDEQRETLAEVRKLGYVTDFRPDYGWIIFDPANEVTLFDVIYAAHSDGLPSMSNVKLIQSIPGNRSFGVDWLFSYLKAYLKSGAFACNKLGDLTTPQTERV